MKKAKQLGYAPLPNGLRSTSPMERASSAGPLTRRPGGGDAAQRRPANKSSFKGVAPGQVSRTGGRGTLAAASAVMHACMQSRARRKSSIAAGPPSLTRRPPRPPALQPAPPARSRDRFISLPDELQGEQQLGQMPPPEKQAPEAAAAVAPAECHRRPPAFCSAQRSCSCSSRRLGCCRWPVPWTCGQRWSVWGQRCGSARPRRSCRR